LLKQYLAAMASLKHNPKLKSFYDHLIANHKPPKVALVAPKRKLLAFMHAIRWISINLVQLSSCDFYTLTPHTMYQN
jgi:hypothetical protein